VEWIHAIRGPGSNPIPHGAARRICIWSVPHNTFGIEEQPVARSPDWTSEGAVGSHGAL